MRDGERERESGREIDNGKRKKDKEIVQVTGLNKSLFLTSMLIATRYSGFWKWKVIGLSGWKGSWTALKDRPASVEVKITPPGLSSTDRSAVRITCQSTSALTASVCLFEMTNQSWGKKTSFSAATSSAIARSVGRSAKVSRLLFFGKFT